MGYANPARQKKYQAAWRARRVAKWIAAGLCRQCGKKPAARFRKCLDCRLIMKKWRVKTAA